MKEWAIEFLLVAAILMFGFGCSGSNKPKFSIDDCIVRLFSYKIISIDDEYYVVKNNRNGIEQLSRNYVDGYFSKFECSEMELK
jgi:hypothetical protein